MSRVILHGNEGGPVELMWPSKWFINATTNGGIGMLPGDAVTSDLAENATKRLEAATHMPFARALNNAVKAGHKPAFATRYLKALMGGGETTATALDLARRRSYFDQPGQVLFEFENRPDRWFRDAWRRFGNGIVIDIPLARSIFAKRLVQTKAKQANELIQEIETAILTGEDEAAAQISYDAMISIDLRKLGSDLMSAKTPAEIKSLWPSVLEIL